MTDAVDSPRVPLGFSFAGLPSGIKVKRRDLALILADGPASAAGRVTTSRTRAASVRRTASLLPTGEARAVVVASGNANAMCGPQAEGDDEAIAASVAEALDVPRESVLTAATGVIGVPFPVDKVAAAVPALVGALGADPRPAAEAMLTTDTTIKLASREIFVNGVRVRVLGIAKGSGMVHPNLATVLGFVLTDAVVAPTALDALLGEAVDESFHMLSVDHETSTNDQVIALASGRAAVRVDDAASESGRALAEAMTGVCQDLARAVARDGEGARKLVTVRLVGAASRDAARWLARAVVASNLVKCALFGGDPGFGRVLAALGAEASAQNLLLDPSTISLTMQGVTVFDRGAPAAFDADALRRALRRPEVDIGVSLAAGEHAATAWGCDMSYDYVRINADYAAVLVASPGGPVYRDQRLETKTPELKKDVLVAALRYIDRFRGTRAVIRYGAATLARADLTARLAEDVRLLAGVGLRPILVQGGAPSELVVTALARAGVRAVGLTPADGHLIRRSQPGAGDAGFAIDPEVVEMLLAKEYVPVIVPEEASGDEDAPTADPDAVAAEIAIACRARKLIYTCEASGLLVRGAAGEAGGDEGGMLISEISADELAQRLEDDSVEPAMRAYARGAVRALAGGVETVHLIDERVPHHVVAELFTETGVGTMVR